MTTLELTVSTTVERQGPVHVEFHSEAELRALIEDAYSSGVRALTCDTRAADQTVRALGATAGVICARRVQDGIAKWVLFLPRREDTPR